MKFRMAENSLFAILLRSPWWISLAIALGVGTLAMVALPEAYAPYGAFGAAPFAVIACMAGWRQLRAPSSKRVTETLDAVREMSWNEFSAAVEEAFVADGCTVKRLDLPAADFEAVKVTRVALVSSKRWKVARPGIKPLQDLVAAARAREADECIFITAGELTDNAAKYAAEHRMRLLSGTALVQWLGASAKARKASARSAA